MCFIQCCAIPTLHLSTCFMQFSGHLYTVSVHMLYAVQWPSLCCICPYVPRSDSGSLCGSCIHIFHTVQLPSLWCVCPCVPCSAVGMSVVPVTIYSMQCSGHLYGFRLFIFHRVQLHLYGFSLPIFLAVQWRQNFIRHKRELLWSILPPPLWPLLGQNFNSPCRPDSIRA
jgi:hypothetical protein